jgi:signal transduction histidine kinase
MKIYTQKRGWKIALFVIAIFIVTGTFVYINVFLQKLARDEKEKVEIWAKAISRQAHLVSYQEQLFKSLQEEQKKNMEVWAKATKLMVLADYDDPNITFFSEIISNNNSIPVIVTDAHRKVKVTKNLSPEFENIDTLTDEVIERFTDYDPMALNYYADIVDYVFYGNSTLYTQLKITLDDLVESFLNEVVNNSLSNEIIITDSTHTKVIAFGGNIDSSVVQSPTRLDSTLRVMSYDNKPIVVDISNYGTSYIHYNDSYLLVQMRYFPIILVIIITVFLIVTYILFSLSRKAEQNMVWAGMAKETAHQLGTPLSSLMGWIDLLKMQDEGRAYEDSNAEALGEMEKDISRLKLVSERFSKIGSQPEMKIENLVELIHGLVAYMKRRTSSKIDWVINLDTETDDVMIPLNRHVFVWVLENLCKNAVDAMEGGAGKIEISLTQSHKDIFLDISDTGKGLPKGAHKTVFKPGFTTKSRGWGLGLSLAKRIIENYHNGRIFVKQSVPGEGTTFRIHLKA